MAAVVRTWWRRPRPDPIWSGVRVGVGRRGGRLRPGGVVVMAVDQGGTPTAAAGGGGGRPDQLGSGPWPPAGGSGLALGVPVWMWSATEWWWLMAMVRAVPRRRPVFSGVGLSASGSRGGSIQDKDIVVV
ncbi:uncharacterized protein [Triticum aestivum]|uniref:uncharacterized protein n=1 Tax=Triticum aestivum TaxID=4565 RepID=UPI001D007EAC|nr:uncharacterized protein LOC123097415 [Triticum aestivum]